MSNHRRLSVLILLSLSLSSCAMPIGVTGSNASLLASALSSYDFEVTAGFQIASVDSGDQSVVDTAKSTFEADLRSGHTTDYQREKTFSIHLLSGSEGNYFTSPEFLASSLKQALATLVVMQDGLDAQIYKGQFDNSRFVFADPGQQFGLTDRTKAYLLTADANFTVQTYKGELVPDSELNTDGTAVTTSVSSAEAGTVVQPMVETVETFDYEDGRQNYNGVVIYDGPNRGFQQGQTTARAYPANEKRNMKNPQPMARTGPMQAVPVPVNMGPGQAFGPIGPPPNNFGGQAAFDPFREDEAKYMPQGVPGKPAMIGIVGKIAPGYPSGNPIPDPNNKARYQPAGWIDANGIFHPADRVVIEKAGEKRKVQEPVYQGPGNP